MYHINNMKSIPFYIYELVGRDHEYLTENQWQHSFFFLGFSFSRFRQKLGAALLKSEFSMGRLVILLLSEPGCVLKLAPVTGRVEKELLTQLSRLLSMRAERVKKACVMFSPLSAQVCMKYTPRSLHHLLTSERSTRQGRSLLLPRRRQVALEARLKARSCQTSRMLFQDSGSDWSKIKMTPSQDLKQVATMDLNFSCPAVSQMQRRTSLSCRLMFLQRKSIVVLG